MTKFKKIKLGDYIDVITDYHANGSYESLKKNINLKKTPDYATMIRTLNFERGDFSNDLLFINKFEYDFLNKSKVNPDDVIMNKIANPGSVYLMPDLGRPVSLAMNLFLIRFSSEVNQRYMFYLMKLSEKYIKQFANGTTTLTITKNAVRNLEFQIPELDIQNKVATILFDIDSKIAINKKINFELNELVKSIYNYWFIHFNFPNNEGLPYRDSGGKMVFNNKTNREIPSSWKVENLKNNSLTKLIKPGINYFDNKKSYFATADISANNINFDASKITLKDKESRANMQPKLNSVWFAKMKNSKKNLYIKDYSEFLLNKSILSTGFCGLECNIDYYVEYVWSFINSDSFEEIKDRNANGATQQAINNQSMEFIDLLIPEDMLLQRYSNTTKEILEEIYRNQVENNTLIKLKEWLMPRLLTGEIEVN